MKNPVICKQCNSENPHYQHTCLNCKSYLRERVVNIDLWKTIALLVESPTKGFQQIIYSEHKNFIVSIIIIAAIKLLIDSIFIGVALKSYAPLSGFFLNYLLLLSIISIFIYAFSFFQNRIDQKIKLITRIKDNFSILVYTLVPHVFALILFILEMIVFGSYLFSYEPSPFFLKSTAAYTFLVFEFLIICWSLFLTFMAAYTQSRSKKYSILVSLFFNLGLYLIIFLFSLTFIV